MNAWKDYIDFLKSDLDRYFHTGFRKSLPEASRIKVLFETWIFKAGFHATFLYRSSHLFYRWGLPWAAWFIQRLSVMLTGAEIEYNAEIGRGLLITHPVGIVIGRGSRIGERFMIYQNVTLGARYLDPVRIYQFPKIEDDVIVFAGAAILGGVTIHSGAVVGANAVVVCDVPAGHSAVGVPARVQSRTEA